MRMGTPPYFLFSNMFLPKMVPVWKKMFIFAAAFNIIGI